MYYIFSSQLLLFHLTLLPSHLFLLEGIMGAQKIQKDQC